MGILSHASNVTMPTKNTNTIYALVKRIKYLSDGFNKGCNDTSFFKPVKILIYGSEYLSIPSTDANTSTTHKTALNWKRGCIFLTAC